MAKKTHAERIALISEWLDTASDETLTRVEKLKKRVETNTTLSKAFDAQAGFDWDAFEAHAAANQWRTRMERGYKRYPDFFGFIQEVYGPWIEKAKAAGVDVTLKVGQGLFHCFPVCAPLFPEATQAMAEICTFIRRQLALTTAVSRK